MGRQRAIHLLVLAVGLLATTAFVPVSHHRRPTTTVYPSVSKPLIIQQPVSTRATALHPLFAAPLVGWATKALPSLALLAGIIVIHESGHYLAARSFGMKVEEFSIGVGPKLLGFKAFGDEFNLRAFPLGGFVRFPENYNATLVRELESIAIKNANAFDKAQEMDTRTKLVNLLTLGSIDDKRRKDAKKRRDAQLAQKQNKKWWSLVQRPSVKDEEIPALLDLDDVKIDYYDDPNLLQNRPWYQRVVVISGGVLFNLLLAWSIYFGQITVGPGLPRPTFDAGAVVSAAPRPNSAASGVLQRGDVILSIDGRPLMDVRPSAYEAEKGINNFISSIRSTPDGESIKLSVLHPSAKAPVEVTIQPSKLSENSPATIGVLLSPNFVKAEVLQTKDIMEASRLAADYTIQLTRATAKGISSALAGIVQGRGESPQVSGPIGLIRTGSEVVATQDWTAVLLFAAAISINLGVVNALPFPALDGGQLLFVLAEAATRRKVDQRVQEGLTGVALLFLLIFSAGAAIGDIESIFGMK